MNSLRQLTHCIFFSYEMLIVHSALSFSFNAERFPPLCLLYVYMDGIGN